MVKKKTEKVEEVQNKILKGADGKEYELIPFTKEGETPELFKVKELEDEIDRLVTLAISGIRARYYYSISSRYMNNHIDEAEQEVYELADKLREKIRG